MTSVTFEIAIAEPREQVVHDKEKAYAAVEMLDTLRFAVELIDGWRTRAGAIVLFIG